MTSDERPAPRSDRAQRRRPVRLRARPAAYGPGPHRRCRRGRPRCLRRPAGGGGSHPRRHQGWRHPGPERLQAADREGPRALLRPDRPTGPVVVGRRHRPRGVRPARHARRERGGAAAGGGAARRGAGLRAHRRVPGRRARCARPGHVEGRPGRRLHRRRLGAGEGHPRPHHVRDARAVAGVRLPDPQGLHHRRARRGPDRARPVAGAPDALRQRPPGRRHRATAGPALDPTVHELVQSTNVAPEERRGESA